MTKDTVTVFRLTDRKLLRKPSELKRSSLRLIEKFFCLLDGLEELLGVILPNPDFLLLPESIVIDEMKKFCCSMIEGKPHLYTSITKKISSTAFFSCAHSLFQFRKVIPSDKPSISDYAKKLSTPISGNYDFHNFCTREIKKIFRKGWDRNYSDYCYRSSLPFKSCYESSRRHGGARSIGVTQFDYLESCSGVNDIGDLHSRISCVESGGKFRLVSVPNYKIHYLSPLHHMMYDHLSKFDWLLRGDANIKSFKEFYPVDGEIFVSGDYESATDNLCQDTQLHILRCVLDQGNFPEKIREFALKSLSCTFECEAGFFQQRRGQMMGNLLSFPLLCLVNYLAFKYSIPREVPVKINGDDIVFRCTAEEADNWFLNVSNSGLVVSKGKTLVSKRFFSLNSVMFRSGNKLPLIVPFINSKSLFCDFKSMKGTFSKFIRGVVGKKKEALQSLFIKVNSSEIYKSRFSLTRGLGLRIRPWVIKKSGMYDRENFYLSLPKEEGIEEKEYFRDATIRCDRIKVKRVNSHDLIEDQYIKDLGFMNRWTKPVKVVVDSENFRPPFIPNRWKSKMSRLLQISITCYRKFISIPESRINEFYPVNDRYHTILRRKLDERNISFIQKKTQG